MLRILGSFQYDVVDDASSTSMLAFVTTNATRTYSVSWLNFMSGKNPALQTDV